MPYQFNLPTITDLSQSQRMALYAQHDDVFLISGCPGSGKTTVALLRAKGKGTDPRHHYTVWANLLYGYLLNLSPQLNVTESHFSTFYSWFWQNYRVSGFVAGGGPNTNEIVRQLKRGAVLYDELQLDEGQDLPLEVRCALSLIAKKMIICMDPAQDVNDECENSGEMERTKELIEQYGKKVTSYRLTTNWRNTRPVFEFSKEIVPELNSQTSVDSFAKLEGKKPSLYKLSGKENIYEKIVSIVKNEPGRNIGILDDSIYNLHKINDALAAAGIKTTIYDSKEHRKRSKSEKITFLRSMSNVVLATFISCKGLEFNTVIIADIARLSDSPAKRKGYYVGCTRAQDRLVLFQDTSAYTLPDWFNQISRNRYDVMNTAHTVNPY